MLTMLPLPETKESTVVVIPADPSLVQARADRVYRQLRVAAYARVSTKKEEQQSSYQAQKQYYTDKINANPQWTLQGIYADEGITGTSTKKRADFNRMIKPGKQGKIDIILTKSLSRFAGIRWTPCNTAGCCARRTSRSYLRKKPSIRLKCLTKSSSRC